MKVYEAPVIEIEKFNIGQIMASGDVPSEPTEGPSTPVIDV